MATQESIYETIRATVLAHLDGYSSPQPFHNETIQRYRTADCVHNLHPVQSIPSPFNEPIDRTKFSGFMTFFGNCISRFTYEVRELVIDSQKRQAVMYLDVNLEMKAFDSEPAVSDYKVQYMWLLQATDDGKRIARVEEFLDPDRLMNYVRPRAQRYAAWMQTQSAI